MVAIGWVCGVNVFYYHMDKWRLRTGSTNDVISPDGRYLLRAE